MASTSGSSDVGQTEKCMFSGRLIYSELWRGRLAPSRRGVHF